MADRTDNASSPEREPYARHRVIDAGLWYRPVVAPVIDVPHVAVSIVP